MVRGGSSRDRGRAASDTRRELRCILCYKLMNPADIDDAIRTLAAARRLPGAHLQRWLALDAPGRARFLELAESLRMRTGQIVNALEALEEIAVREQTSVAEILRREEIVRISSGPAAAPARASALLKTIGAIRFPQLKKMQARLRSEIAALKMPNGISVALPIELGSDELTVSIVVRSGGELARLLKVLDEKEPALARIIDLLGGS